MSDERIIQTFEDLECWKAGRRLRVFVARQVVPKLPRDERYRLGDQVLRAGRSITANIAEGYGRYHFLDSAKFLMIARGSTWEVLDHLITGADEGIISTELLGEGRRLVVLAVKLNCGYANYLKRRASGQSRSDSP